MNPGEIFSKNPTRIVMIIGGLLVLSLALLAFQMRGSNPGGSMRTRAFFSIDDGKTWFVDDAAKLPPFEKDGKQAVIAHVYRRADGASFVGYLERFKAEARDALEKANTLDSNDKRKIDQSAVQSAYVGGREIKRPGDPKWVGTGSRDAGQIMAVKSPDGGKAVPVEP